MHLPANLTDCDELDAAWTDCSFDDTATAEIDAHLNAEEEFTISFWFKNLDATPCDGNCRRVVPIFRFFSSLAPLRMDYMVNRDGFFEIFDPAAGSYFYSGFEQTELAKAYRPDAWNAVTIG